MSYEGFFAAPSSSVSIGLGGFTTGTCCCCIAGGISALSLDTERDVPGPEPSDREPDPGNGESVPPNGDALGTESSILVESCNSYRAWVRICLKIKKLKFRMFEKQLEYNRLMYITIHNI